MAKKQQETKGKLKKGEIKRNSTDGKATPPPKILPTTSYSIFEYSINRAKNLIKIHGLSHGKATRPPAYLADALRAAVVLAVSALDAFVRTFVIERITEIVKDPSCKMEDKLKKRIQEDLGLDELFDAARKSDLPSRVQAKFAQKFSEESFQGISKIISVMQLIGYEDVFHTIAIAAPTNEDNLKSNVGQCTQRRHQIGHTGDYDLNQTVPVENKIDKKYVDKCIKNIELVAREINKLK